MDKLSDKMKIKQKLFIFFDKARFDRLEEKVSNSTEIDQIKASVHLVQEMISNFKEDLFLFQRGDSPIKERALTNKINQSVNDNKSLISPSKTQSLSSSGLKSKTSSQINLIRSAKSDWSPFALPLAPTKAFGLRNYTNAPPVKRIEQTSKLPPNSYLNRSVESIPVDAEVEQQSEKKQLRKTASQPKYQPYNPPTKKLNGNLSRSVSAIKSQPLFVKKDKPTTSVFNNPDSKFFYILANSSVIDSKTRFRFLMINKTLYSQIDFKEEAKKVVSEKLAILKKRLVLNEIIINRNLSEMNTVNPKYNNYFTPSITSQQGLNMVRIEDIRLLGKKLEPDPSLIEVFKYVCLFLNESIDKVEDEEIITHFVENVFPKYKVDTIKQLFLNIVAKIRFNHNQCGKVEELNQVSFDLLNPSAILRLHKSTSYMIYFIKDLADFMTKKTSIGDYYILLNYAVNDNMSLRKRIETLQSF